MLAGKYHLRGTDKFKEVEERGKIFQSDSFGLSYFNRGDRDVSLFGFIVSKKIAGEAALRNRAKRAMSEAVRINMGQAKPGFDVVFLAKQKILRNSTESIMREVGVALKETGILK